VQARDPLWHQKLLRRYQAPRAEALAVAEVAEDPGSIHMPSPSYFPLITALGMPMIAFGLIYQNESHALFGLVAAGVVVLLLGAYGWALEPS